MEKREYVKPAVEELCQLHDVTGGIFDILEDLLGGLTGKRPPKGSN